MKEKWQLLLELLRELGKQRRIALAELGATVAIAARREDRLKALAEKIAANGGKALPIVTDITNETQVNQLVERVIKELGHLDILVNNAGIAFLGTIENGNPADWRTSFEVNVLGVLYATHAALPFFKQQQSGHIVNISSVAGRTVRAGIGVYNATKWGVNALSEALRQEVYKDNIRVTVIEPGLVRTEIINHISDPEAKKKTEERYKVLTPLEVEDIAGAIVYAVTQPSRVNVNEILIRPTGQEH